MLLSLLLASTALAADKVETYRFDVFSADLGVGTGVWGVAAEDGQTGVSGTGALLVQAGPIAVAAGLPWTGQFDTDVRAHFTFRLGQLQTFVGVTAFSQRAGRSSVVPGMALGAELDLSQWPVPGGETPLVVRAWLWGMGSGASFRSEAMLGSGPVRFWGAVGSVPYVGPERTYFAVGLALKPWSAPAPPPREKRRW